MVLTQLQLKWPNHSTHLLTRLTYLFKNEQLVDCTLMCNKHCLKVHRSVLAACSPYFERELQNNPSIVVKDMQFSVLKALIEFMYYGETRITEENLTSLIEAAKIFEVKGLSEMDIVSGKNGIVSSLVALDNDCIVESSCLSDDIDKANFEAATILQQSLAHSTAATSSTSMLDNNAITTTSNCNSSIAHCTESNDAGGSLYEDPNGADLMVESTSNGTMLHDDQHQQHQGLHSSRNFVVTPPQTESAQILLSLARSHTQKMFSSHITQDDVTLSNGNEESNGGENGFLNHDQYCGQDNGNVSVIGFDHQQQQQLLQRSINNSDVLFVEQNLILNDTSNGSSLISMASGSSGHQDDVESECSAGDASSGGGKSLLAKLLTRNNHEIEQTVTTECAKSCGSKNTTNTSIMAADLQPSIILECPFLIETTDGAYVDVCVENMLNSLDGDAVETSPATLTDAEQPLYEVPSSATTVGIADPAILERIKHDTAPELENDPEAVVLTKISEDGRVEKYVLSSADVQALIQMNERLAAAKAASRPSSADMATEIELPGASDDTPLITRIMVDGTGGIQNAINRLPFKRSVVGAPAANSGQPETSSSGDCVHDAILDNSLAVDDTHHHHENMFEELDNQFNTMDCCAIDDEEHIRRDYVAYEEASKNETQLEHNYYANALKCEDEEGVAISDQYDLRMMMMVEETPQSDIIQDTTTSAVAKSSSSLKKRYQNVQVLGSSTSTTTSNSIANICLNGNTLVAFNSGKSTLSTAPSATLRINGGGVVSNIALADKPITVVPSNGSGAGKCDLIINDALMSSVLNVVPITTVPTTATTLVVKNTPPVSATKRKVAAENVLPFKSVKSANTFRNSNSKKSASSTTTKRTYSRRKTTNNTSNLDQNQRQKIVTPLNGGFSNEHNLIEEIIVDEIS